MLYFTILRDARQLVYCPTINGEMGKEQPPMYVNFYSTEAIVASREGQTCLFYVRDIRTEGKAAISGYMVAGEDQL